MYIEVVKIIKENRNVPKDLVREYETPEGSKVREVGPIVYGYSMTIGPDGKPRVREFRNVRSPFSSSSRGVEFLFLFYFIFISLS